MIRQILLISFYYFGYLRQEAVAALLEGTLQMLLEKFNFAKKKRN
ncbi:MAG: hypothetical protein ACEY3J_00840 [Arsenophonus sp.]